MTTTFNAAATKTVGVNATNFEFTFTRLERIAFGPGKITTLGAELERMGATRALVVTGKTLGASRLLERVTAAMGPHCAGVFAGVGQHVPASSVRALVAEAERVGADALVAFGGGSPIDACKLAAASLLSGRDMTLVAGEIDFDGAGRQAAGDPARRRAHHALCRRVHARRRRGHRPRATRVKHRVSDARLQHRIVIYDPELCLNTPDWLWVATGMRALDHAIEGIYSTRAQPFTDTLGAEAIRLMMAHLPGSIGGGSDRLAERGWCQIAAWHSFFGGASTGMGVSHALGHEIGPHWDVPHGVTSCITLPHVMRFMADVAPQRFRRIAEALDVPFDDPRAAALASADKVAAFIAGFDVPHSLKAAGVERAEIHDIAEAVADEVAHAKIVERPVTVNEIKGLLDAVYE